MLKSTFIAFYRSFIRHPLYALLNLLGLSFGIAVLLTLSLFFRFETTYEQWVPNADKLYAVENAWTFDAQTTDPEPWTSGVLLDDIRSDYPQIPATRLWDQNTTVHIGAQSTRETQMIVDSEFFKVFDIPLVAGAKATALSSPDYILISRAMAEKYFPGVKASAIIGKTLRLTDDDATHDYRVSAVLENPPANSGLKFDIVRLLTPQYKDKINNWKNYGSQRLRTILRLDDPAMAARLNKAFPAFIDRHAAANFAPDVPHTLLKATVYPLTGLHLQDEKTRTSVYVLGLVGILAFLIAAINYINLATARAGMRAREVAVRKTLGATQGMLRMQFLCEAGLTTLVAILIGLSLVEVSLPLINSFGGLQLKLDYMHDWPTLVIAAGFILAIGLLAGLYPAFVLAGFKPAQVLASSRTPAGGRFAIRMREALVVLQFAVVIAFFIMVSGFLSQIRHMKNADLGFQREGVLIISSTYDAAVTDGQRESAWAAFRALPGVTYVTAGNAAPGDGTLTNATSVAVEGYVGRKPSINWVRTSRDYFLAYGGKLIAGRPFDPKYSEDQFPEGEGLPPPGLINNIILNRSAVKALGFKSPEAALGRLLDFDINKVRVVGVVEDMRFRSPKDKIPPTLYIYEDHMQLHAITGVKYAGVSDPVMRARVQAAWRQVAPEVPFEAVSATENVDAFYKPDRNRSNLFTLGALIAALIGCIGLYGMAAFNTSRRAREIGLRKVLGASAGKVVGLLVGQFLRPVVIANIIAWPLAWYALKSWLSQFDDPIALNIGYFLVASGVALAIALVTVAGLALASASTEPGKALRHD